MRDLENRGMTRRRFMLASAAAGTVPLLLNFFQLASAAQATKHTIKPAKIVYRDFGDIYRKAWTWDKVAKGTHTCINCLGGCSWDVYVKHGIVWREEQNAVYEAPRDDVPDMNPRGCQKGGSYSHLQIDGSRVLHPLKRVGPRGSGKWKRLSWDDAFTEISDKMIDIAVADGTESIIFERMPPSAGSETAAIHHFYEAAELTVLDIVAGAGDMPMGAIQTMGMYASEGTSDDWFRSDYIVVWSCNPTYTRIPEAHFLYEARYKGAKLVVIAPDLNATAVHADFWINPKMETDSAFALAAAKVIIDENLYKKDHVIEQTDLPFLVRSDGRFLRQSDLQHNGKDDVFYLWDELQKRPVEAPGCEGMDDGVSEMMLDLKGLQPALDGRFSVRLKDGRSESVTTVFHRLRDHLDRNFTLETASKITSVHPTVIQRFAREFANAKAAMILATYGACKSFHSDLLQRAMILLTALTAQQGRPGTGMRPASAFWGLPSYHKMFSSIDRLAIPPEVVGEIGKRMGRAGGFNMRDSNYVLREVTPLLPYVPLLPFLYVHGGYDKVWDRKEFADASLPRPLADYVKQAIEKNWIPMRPAKGASPRALICVGANSLRRWPMPQVAEEHLWPKLDLVVSVDFRMSTTARKSDYVLPAAGYYEKFGIKNPISYVPYLIFTDECVKPLGESKSEWFLFGEFAKCISRRATERNIGKVRGALGKMFDLRDCYDRWSSGGKDGIDTPNSEIRYIDRFLEENAAVLRTLSGEPLSGQQALRDGAVRITSDPGSKNLQPAAFYAACTDYSEKDTLAPYAWQVHDKKIWPTLTGRQQFLIDHEWFIEAGEDLPVYKDSPEAGGNYPLRLNGGHTRWSIHAAWRDATLMLRLQRGEPVCFMHPGDCKLRGIEDGDYARVYNEIGEFEVMVKIAPSAQPGEVIIYHAWEPFQFKGWKGSQEPVVAPWKAIHLAGGYHLQYRLYYGPAHHAPRGTRVEVKFARAGARLPAHIGRNGATEGSQSSNLLSEGLRHAG